MTTIQDYIDAHNLDMTFEQIDSRDTLSAEWDRGSRHFRVHIGGFSCEYSMGPGLTADPELSDVLESLSLDFSGMLNASSFEDWCSEYGYDTDSRRAYAMYEAIAAQMAEWDAVFSKGTDATQELAALEV